MGIRFEPSGQHPEGRILQVVLAERIFDPQPEPVTILCPDYRLPGRRKSPLPVGLNQGGRFIGYYTTCPCGREAQRMADDVPLHHLVVTDEPREEAVAFPWESSFICTRFRSFSSEITASAQRVPRASFKKVAGVVPERKPELQWVRLASQIEGEPLGLVIIQDVV